jgi:citrate synthase
MEKLDAMTQQYRKNAEKAARIAGESRERYSIPPELYGVHDVKRGLRDADGKGVVAGLTTVSQVTASRMENGVRVPDEGKLYYRGIRIQDLVDGFISRDRFGFEEIVYLLLTGELPDEAQLDEFHEIMSEYQILPEKFKSGIIMKMPSDNIMSMMEKCVLSLHAVDPNPDDTSIENVMRQSLELIARFPAMAVYSYQASLYFRQGESMVYHRPDPTKTIAENFLIMLRPDGQYTQLEARLLDLALVLHAEHGGGNNSSFTTHVVTSSFTDIYSSVAASILSLKGSRHGGANLRVMRQMDEIKNNVKDWRDPKNVQKYLERIADKKAGDRTGLIYGLGHAVYTISDPRAQMLKSKARKLAREKGREDEMKLFECVEELGPAIIKSRHPRAEDVCANVDLYSGFVYDMLGIPKDLYTPLFAVARCVSWCAHRMEELINCGPIIRPAYKPLFHPKKYIALKDR